jgi:fatty-acyl-CoA synthase
LTTPTTTAPEQPSTTDAVIRRSAARYPGRLALEFGARRWTYADLDAAVSRAARWLLRLGLTFGDRVATYGKNSDAYLLAWLGCSRAGLVHVPVNFNLTGSDLSYILGQSGSRAVLVDPPLAAALEDARADRPDDVEFVVALRDEENSFLAGILDVSTWGDGESLAGAAEEPPLPDVTDTDLAQLLYTSGTTSLPKGAMMTHRALLHEYMSCLAALDAAPDQKMLHALPLYHSAQMHVFLMPWLMIGARNVLLEAPAAGAVFDAIETGGCDSFFAAPTVRVGLTNHPEFASRDLSGLRRAYYGASIMPGPILERLQRRLPGLGVYNCFGQSEIGPLATVLRPEEHVDRPASCGRPVLFVEARCVDETGVDVAPGQRGEVIYRSPQLLTGYWADEKATVEGFRDGWFRSGDLAIRDEEGYYTIVDRIKDVINTGGVLVASREVEDAMYGHPAVGEVAVIGIPDEKWIEAIVAVVVVKDPEVTPDELIADARSRLPGFKTPKQVKIVPELPRNASGKLLKRVLRDEFDSL